VPHGQSSSTCETARVAPDKGEDSRHKHKQRRIPNQACTTQYSADQGSDTATQRVEGLLEKQSLPQIQHIMGWGAGNPEPSKGRYDFSEMDRRIDIYRRYHRGYGEILVQMNVEDTRLGVAEYVLEKHGIQTIVAHHLLRRGQRLTHQRVDNHAI
jgi:hypothetical protein